MKEKKWCVYKHTNTANGKIYIGITCKNPLSRWEYGRGYRHNSHMNGAILKYGWDAFSHEILFTELSQDEALKIERELIAEYKSADRRYGYNIEAGGVKKGALSEETLHKMRLRMLGENNPNYGKHLSEETRKKLSECNKGSKHPKYGTHHSEETIRKLSEQKMGENNWNYGRSTPEKTKEKMRRRGDCKQVRCEETGVIYFSIGEASRQTGVSSSNISLVCKGTQRYKTAGGYHWTFVE